MGEEKIVDFRYCVDCEHYSRPENEDPCWDCLNEPTRVYSSMPVYFKAKEKNNSQKKQRL